MTTFSCVGRRALITGSTRGIGHAIAKALACAGASVVLHGRDARGAEQAAKQFRMDGFSADWTAFDVADREGVATGAKAVEMRAGPIDILVNNAGVNIRKGLAEASPADWDTVMSVDLTSCFVLCQQLAPGMIERGWGRVINIASIMSFLARPGIPAYAAAKHGLVGLTRALAAELGPKRITVNAIGPGFIETDATAVHATNPEFNAMVLRRTAVGRWGRPEDIGGAAVFLASEEASFVNGHTLMVDGGLTATV